MRISAEDRERIRKAVAAAETTTRAEVVCVVADTASDYREVPLAWAAIAAFAAPLAWVFGSVPWMAPSGGWASGNAIRHANTALEIIGTYAFWQFIVFIVVLAVASLPPIARILTPGALRRAAVHRRAIEHFHAQGLQHTHERTGVLIFASLEDRMAEIVADTGINQKAESGAWGGVISVLTAEIRKGRAAEGFVAAVTACSALLDKAFPAAAVNPNELGDELVEVRRP